MEKVGVALSVICDGDAAVLVEKTEKDTTSLIMLTLITFPSWILMMWPVAPASVSRLRSFRREGHLIAAGSTDLIRSYSKSRDGGKGMTLLH